MANDDAYITLYGQLEDKFGNNGVVSVVIGKKKKGALFVDATTKSVSSDAPITELDIILWLMSCRVLKRDMEFAMMDTLVEQAQNRGILKIAGYYYPTAKNSMKRSTLSSSTFPTTTPNIRSTRPSFQTWLPPTSPTARRTPTR